MPPTPETARQCKVRLKAALEQRLDAAAKQNKTSRNVEIVRRLELSFTRDPVIGLVADVKRLLALANEDA
jgi:hypothetical protein